MARRRDSLAGGVSDLIGQPAVAETKKKKYAVNIIFDGEMEPLIREAARNAGLPVASYIKHLVAQDINSKKI